MTPADERLHAALSEYNRHQLDEFRAETGLRYLGADGPVYIAGLVSTLQGGNQAAASGVRIRALFVDAAGGHWCDAGLVVESAYHRRLHPRHDYYRNEIAFLDEAHGLHVVTLERGEHSADIAPIPAVCSRLDLGEPELFPPGGWCRNWSTWEWEYDDRALVGVASGLPYSPEPLGRAS